MVLVITAIKHINPAQGVLVVYGLVDSNDEGEGRGQLDSAAELLVTPVQAAQSLSQITTARTLKTILQKLGFVRFVPGTLIPINQWHKSSELPPINTNTTLIEKGVSFVK